MIKRELVEEIAKERNEIKDLMKLLDKCVSLNPMCKAEVATVVYGNNYRKIPEDSVVLSREEYEMLVNQYKNLEIKYSNLCDNYRLCKDANETLKQNIIITRKETAKEILTAIGNITVGGLMTKLKYDMDFRNICTKYGVEVE